MSNNIEIEAKVILQKNDYLKVKEFLKLNDENSVIQTNHYIDSRERILKKLGIALRIREINEEYHLTLKTPLSEGLLEKDQILTDEEFNCMVNDSIFPKGTIEEFLEILDLDSEKLYVLTSLTTKRLQTDYLGGKVSLDENSYSNMVDYELEIEDSSMANAENLINDLLGRLKIKYTYNHISKQSRAIQLVTNK